MTYEELASLLIGHLEPIYGDRESRAIQKYIFTSLWGIDTARWLVQRNEQVNDEAVHTVKSLLPKLMDHVPVQYVVGKAYSNDLEFVVTPDVLIPRPETEELINLIIKKHSKEKNFSILDIGTGSGVIAISLAKFLPNSTVTAMDVSTKALEVAALNASINRVDVKFLNDNILDSKVTIDEKFDIIVSNPPYVKDSEASLMQPNVLKHEPYLALFVRDDDPLVFYDAIMKYAMVNLVSGGELWFEINENEGENIQRLLQERGFIDVEILHDFNSRPRFSKARWLR